MCTNNFLFLLQKEGGPLPIIHMKLHRETQSKQRKENGRNLTTFKC